MKTKDESYFDGIELGALGGTLGINGAYNNESIQSFKERFEDSHNFEKLNAYVRLGSANNFIKKNYSYILGAFKTQVQNKIYYIVVYKHYNNPAESWLDR